MKRLSQQIIADSTPEGFRKHFLKKANGDAELATALENQLMEDIKNAPDPCYTEEPDTEEFDDEIIFTKEFSEDKFEQIWWIVDDTTILKTEVIKIIEDLQKLILSPDITTVGKLLHHNGKTLSILLRR
jgi:hypothetical protein